MKHKGDPQRIPIGGMRSIKEYITWRYYERIPRDQILQELIDAGYDRKKAIDQIANILGALRRRAKGL